MLKRLIVYLLGHLRIEVRGGRLERFLNLALEQGIYLWNIERKEDLMRASITINDFFVLRPVARGAGSRVRLLGRYGFPFVVNRLKRRPALIAGALASLGFLYWASGHVWIISVRITPPQNLDERAVRAVAAEAGLAPGVWTSRIDLKQVQQHIQNRMGEVSWAIVRVQGTRAVIEIVEKRSKAVGPDQAACLHLVAARHAVVEKVVPFQGEPVVKKGDIVKPGDMLVECAFKYWEGGRPSVYPGTQPPPRSNVARTVVAQAMVYGRITHTQYREVPLVQEVSTPTGRTAAQWVLKWNDRSILLKGGDGFPSQDGLPFGPYREHRQTYSLGSWRNWRSPVELVILTAEEVEIRKERIPIGAALKQVKEEMEARLRWMLGPTDKVITPIRTEVIEQKPEYLGVRVWVETLEEIARPQEGLPIPVPPRQAPGTSP